MCNINILIKNNNNTTQQKIAVGFLHSVTSNSFSSNSHGEGIFCNGDNSLIKSLNKIDYTKLENSINKSSVIITHQRYATSGEGLKYNHPFVNKNFVLVHNGIINHFKDSFKDTKHSDTFCFWIIFNNEFNKRIKENTNREAVITEIIKELFEGDRGSYSVFIYDKIQNKGYYFKDSVTNIHIYKSKNYLYITTNNSNHLFLTMLNEKFIEYDIKKRVIYDINIEKLGVYTLFGWKDKKDNWDNWSWDKKDKKKQKQKEKAEKNNNTTQQKKEDFLLYDNSLYTDNIRCASCNSEIIGSVYFKNDEFLCGECVGSNYSKLNIIDDGGY